MVAQPETKQMDGIQVWKSIDSIITGGCQELKTHLYMVIDRKFKKNSLIHFASGAQVRS